MATFSNISQMFLCFMISSTLMVKIGLSQDAPEPSNAPGPMSSYVKYLANCGSHLSPNCGDEVFSAIFFGNKTVSEYCCDKLVNDVGKMCHDDMTKYILTLPKFRAHETQILKRSQTVWFDCVLQDYPWIGPAVAES